LNASLVRIKNYSQFNKQRSVLVCTLLRNLFGRKNNFYLRYGIKKLQRHKDEEIKREI